MVGTAGASKIKYTRSFTCWESKIKSDERVLLEIQLEDHGKIRQRKYKQITSPDVKIVRETGGKKVSLSHLKHMLLVRGPWQFRVLKSVQAFVTERPALTCASCWNRETNALFVRSIAFRNV